MIRINNEKRKRNIINLLAASFFFFLVIGVYKTISAQKDYFPSDYRKWHHAKTMILEEGHPLFEAFGGIHHVYVNDKAYKSIKRGEGRKFEDGSVIVFDLLEVKKSQGAVEEGNRKVLAYMRKDSKNKELEKTGGWEYKAFAGGDPKNQIVNDPVGQCHNCHTQVKDKDFVFSEWRN